MQFRREKAKSQRCCSSEGGQRRRVNQQLAGRPTRLPFIILEGTTVCKQDTAHDTRNTSGDGAVVTTAVEYAVHWGYERFLGVRFWDYSKVWGNVHGRVCLPFTLIWGVLTAMAVRLFQPGIAAFVETIPAAVTYACLLLFTADTVCSARFLWVTHDVEGLAFL